jgi:hypothetical protein
MRENATLFVLMGIAAAIVVIFLYPFLRDYGHPWVTLPIAIFFALLLIYGRSNPRPRRRPRI